MAACTNGDDTTDPRDEPDDSVREDDTADEGEVDDAVEDADDTADDATADDGSDTADTADDAHDASAAPESGGDPIGSVESTWPGQPSAVRQDVMSLTRRDELLELRLNMTNTGDERVGFDADFGWTGGEWSLGNYVLEDLAGGQRYHVVLDSEGDCLCSLLPLRLEAGETLEFFAMFPAPPEDVTTLDLVPVYAPPVRDLPVG
ncbi:MAG: hypothetical protein WD225_01715 [Ilumatobacteraceae bacterium]